MNYVLIPGTGGFPSVISGTDAQSRIADNDDYALEHTSRFSDLLSQRGAGDVPFWFAGNDVIIRGNMQTAWTISHLVQEFPNMVPSAKADNDNAGLFAPKAHIAASFADAVNLNPLASAPDMTSSFTQASAYENATGRRLPSYGYGRRAAGIERHVA